ncbi:MAG TPA: beta-ketoacyl synthase N-terminal-like domain-containing protein [Acidimicrobiales bacterium]|nr:beta-ketoacyl synthase N-terminal-like domain-containing protein [Acidimicrobiales bacterium]
MSQTQSPEAHQDERQRPVVTGLGAVTAYGWGEKRVRDGLYSARSAVSPVPAPASASVHDVRWMAVVSDEGEAVDGPDPVARAARFAAREAFADAWERGWRPGGSVGVIHAVAGAASGGSADVVAQIAHELAAAGPTMTVTGGSTAGAAALISATTWIAAGLADDVVVVATDLSASHGQPATTNGVPSLHTEAPARVVCRPFQEGSIGPNPGEASVAFVLSSQSAGAYGAVAGWALTQGTAPRPGVPDRVQLGQAVATALSVADLPATSVAYLNAHGSGVPDSDTAEAGLLDGPFAGAAGVYSLKPLLGDCGAASALVELLAVLYGFATGVVPAAPRHGAGHARLLDGPTAAVDGPVVKTSIGPTGQIAALVVRPGD